MSVCAGLELVSSDDEICSFPQLMRGAEALVIIFTPYCFADAVDNSIECLLLDVNQRIDEFASHDIRVICVTREPPSTVRHWISDRNLQMDVFSDPSLSVCDALVGSFDLSLYLLATKGIQLGSHFVAMPAVVVVSDSGEVIDKCIFPSPELVDLTPDDLLVMAGVTTS